MYTGDFYTQIWEVRGREPCFLVCSPSVYSVLDSRTKLATWFLEERKSESVNRAKYSGGEVQAFLNQGFPWAAREQS